jgi:hypothetical protein
MAGRGVAAAVSLSLSLYVAAVAQAAENEDLARAEQLMDALRYSDAAKALDAARAQPGLDRPTLLRILELQGIVAASMGRVDQARSAFRLLVSLDPERSLKGKFSPKVTAPFYEAKGWVVENGGLRFEAAPPLLGQGTVDAVVVRVPADPMKAGDKVRFHLREGGGEPRVVEAKLEGGAARAETRGNPVAWWAELLGDRAEVLALIGSEEAPLTAQAEGGAAVTTTSPTGTPQVTQAGRGSDKPLLRTLSYVALGGGVVALGAGGVFGIQSSVARGQLASAERDSLGRVTGMTQRQAVELDQRARDNAVLANVLFGAGGALAVAGGVLWLSSAEAPVAVVLPTGNGFAISGVLP